MMKFAITAAVLVLAGVWAFGPAALAVHEHGARLGAADSCAAACMGKMADLDAAVTAATQAIQEGNKDVALAELKKVRGYLDGIKASTPTASPVAEPASPYVNALCPIRNVKIDPAKVTPELTREWKDKKVAFCCRGCPAKWDKMTDEEKQASLDKVTPKPSATPVPDAKEKAHRTGGGCCGGGK